MIATLNAIIILNSSENDELVSPKEDNSKKSILDKIPLFRKKKTVRLSLIF